MISFKKYINMWSNQKNYNKTNPHNNMSVKIFTLFLHTFNSFIFFKKNMGDSRRLSTEHPKNLAYYWTPNDMEHHITRLLLVWYMSLPFTIWNLSVCLLNVNECILRYFPNYIWRFWTLKVVKMTFSTDVRDRHSNVTNVRTSGKASLA